MAQLMGRSTNQLKEWRRTLGFPYPDGHSSRIVLQEVFSWLSDILAALPKQAMQRRLARTSSQEELDPQLMGPNSPAMERYRTAQAQLAELKLKERNREMVAIELVNKIHTQWSDRLRKVCEILERKYDRKAAELLRNGLDDCEKMLLTMSSEDDVCQQS